ncbi:unnamed protein product [Vitrella brassicaformis CCMP3155]|uniref:Uncharacterized protein n=2 Tax=Vitrella brassicaformis (strain CCMP3155) TaxID=1169540 RepID=A0A0G4FVT5_VITBC|nr:unnamed protein product [Vitrella brassicaformis CCMP3155]|eukprot:CEM18708.1 unnamed protein product [Vitrella brassicaformis CCMP3155]
MRAVKKGIVQRPDGREWHAAIRRTFVLAIRRRRSGQHKKRLRMRAKLPAEWYAKAEEVTDVLDHHWHTQDIPVCDEVCEELIQTRKAAVDKWLTEQTNQMPGVCGVRADGRRQSFQFRFRQLVDMVTSLPSGELPSRDYRRIQTQSTDSSTFKSGGNVEKREKTTLKNVIQIAGFALPDETVAPPPAAAAKKRPTRHSEHHSEAASAACPPTAMIAYKRRSHAAEDRFLVTIRDGKELPLARRAQPARRASQAPPSPPLPHRLPSSPERYARSRSPIDMRGVALVDGRKLPLGRELADAARVLQGAADEDVLAGGGGVGVQAASFKVELAGQFDAVMRRELAKLGHMRRCPAPAGR